MTSGATSLAEDKVQFKTDVNLILGNEQKLRAYVLRATHLALPQWKDHNVGVGIAPYEECHHINKDAAVIDNEMWVYQINATIAQDIVSAVTIASKYFRVDPAIFLRDIYVKNLNDDREDDLSKNQLIRANKQLYSGVCSALSEAARQLGVSGRLQLYVFSHNKNYKIPQNDLHEALLSGGADSVVTDIHKPWATSGSNDGKDKLKIKTNFHLATINL